MSQDPPDDDVLAIKDLFYIPPVQEEKRYRTGKLGTLSSRFYSSSSVSSGAPAGPVFDNPYVVEFDGLGERILLTASNDLNQQRTEFTISFWYKLLGAPRIAGNIFQIAQSSNASTCLLQSSNVVGNANGITAFISSTATYKRISGSALWLDRWHHVVAVFNGNESFMKNRWKLYVDAVGTSSYWTQATAGTHPTSTAVHNGVNNNIFTNATSVRARMDQFLFINKSCSIPEIESLYNNGTPQHPTNSVSASNIVAWWRCGSGSASGSTDNDVFPRLLDSANNNTGTAINMEAADFMVVDPPSPEVFTTSSYSISFNGINQHISSTHNINMMPRSAFHINFWAKFNQFGNGVARNVLQRMTNDNTISYLLQTDDATQGELKFFLSSSNNWVRTVGAGLQAGTWYNIAVNYSGNVSDASDRVNFYVNGVKTGRTNTTLFPTGTFVPLTGIIYFAHTGSGAVFNGSLGDLAIFHVSKSDNEVLQYYNSGVATNLRYMSGCMLYWRPTELNHESFPHILDYARYIITGTLANMTITNYVTGWI